MNITLPGGRMIGHGEPCFIVAELGGTHNGNAYLATRLIKAAHDAGADAVKFQKRHIASDLTAAARAMPYEGPQSFGKTYGEHRKRLELSSDEYRHLAERMRYNGWPEVLFATACDQESVDDLEKTIRPPLYKVASRDLDNIPLLEYLAKLHKPVFLSTGMARDEAEIESAFDALGDCPIVLMVCTSEYPTLNSHVRLWRLAEYRKRFGVLVGLSDHTPGITAGIAAVALGACVVEKHLTLSRAMKGTDHAASLEPEGMRRMVEKIREVEEMMDRGGFVDVQETRNKLGRSWVSVREIAAGVKIRREDLCLKSPGTGIPAAELELIVGKMARRTIPADITIQKSDVLTEAVVNV